MLSFLVGCAAPPPVGDLDLVVVGAPRIAVDSATAAVERLVLGPCDGELADVWVGYRMNLMRPEPIPVPVDLYCDLGVEFASDPFGGSLRVTGRTSGGTTFALYLDPGLAVREREVAFAIDTEGILALDMALLLEDDDIAAIETIGTSVVIEPDTALATTLADRVGDALVFFETPEAAVATYVDLWPDFDLSIRADVAVQGCQVDAPVVYRPPDDSVSEPIEADSDAPEPGPGPSSAGCGGSGGGCDGGGCTASSPGCDCGAGCDAQCSTGGLAPAGWCVGIALFARRRRRTLGARVGTAAVSPRASQRGSP